MLSKQIFYLTSDQLRAYQWRAGALSAGESFNADAHGMAAFGAYLEQSPDVPAYVVADVIEEDFHRLLLPHLGGRPWRDMVQRRLGQLYRDTPYRMARVQGRETEGRRDDRMLFSALTNPAVMQGWIALIERQAVPLAAVYSTSFLAEVLVQKLGLAQPHLLLVTRQSGGLRQSYFQGRALKFSRLTTAFGDDGMISTIVAETAKTQQFLTSTRLVERGDIMRVTILAEPELVPALEQACDDGPEIAFRFIALDQAAAQLGIADEPQLSDQLLMAMIGKYAPPTHYDLDGQFRFYQMWQTRRALYVGTATVLAGAALLGLANLYGMWSAAGQTARLRTEARQLDSRYEAVMATLPPTVDKTGNMKAAVLLEQMIAAQGPRPEPLLLALSAALERTPEVNLVSLEWKAEEAGAQGKAGTLQVETNTGAAAPPISSVLIGVPARPVQTLRIAGDVTLPPGDYRSALAGMNQLAAQLARAPGVQVEVVEPPLDVRPTVKLAGKAGVPEPEPRARFVLKAVRRP